MRDFCRDDSEVFGSVEKPMQKVSWSIERISIISFLTLFCNSAVVNVTAY